MFGLIGSLVDISLVDPNLLLISTILIVIALVMRTMGVLLAMAGTELNWQEKAFMAAAWVPKATVQAALSTEIFEEASKLGMHTQTVWG